MLAKKQRNEIVALVILLVVAGAVWYFYFGRAKPEQGVLSASGTYTPIDAQDFGVIFGPLQRSQATEYKPTGRNIFVAGPIPVTPAPGGAKQVDNKPRHEPIGPQPDPPPPPAQLPMKFFGYGSLPSGGPRQAFLLDPEENVVHIVSEGETVLSHIRILHIGTERIDFEDINTGQRGSNTLEVAPAA
jgi:hypothetical protein